MTEWVSVEDATATPAGEAEVLALALDVVSGWYPAGPIDWDDVWDRLDGVTLACGRRLNVGDDLEAAGLRRIRNHVRRYRRGDEPRPEPP